MRSTAHIAGHPIHPILIAFPIAFGAAAPAFDLAGVLGDWPTVWSAGAYLAAAAVVAGLVAGVPGFIDYVYTVPPDSSAKTRATWHMVVNLTALAAIAAGWAYRDLTTLRPTNAVIGLELLGFVVMTAGGWLGGALVSRNQISVDHRYAGGGKWKEERVAGHPGAAVGVAKADELAVGQMKLLHANGRRVVLARVAAGHVACADRCPHRGGSLADGVLAGGVLTCPWHGSQFDATTGAVVAGPAVEPIQTLQVETAPGEVRLVLPAK